MSAPPPGPPQPLDDEPTLAEKVRHVVVGKPKDLADKRVFHHLSLIAFLAWVGLGADGLSSSAYGPEEAFKALGEHRYLAIGLAVATAVTVMIISYAYSRVIEHFPGGGGGYVVTSSLLGPAVGVVSGSALIVDYMLTISISIAAGADAVFSFLPKEMAAWKLPAAFAVVILLVLLNMRGVKESVMVLAPIFLTFLVTHAVLIVGVIVGRFDQFPLVWGEVRHDFAIDVHGGVGALGLVGVFALFVRAYAMGGGTYTGIEAVSNGLQIMREPRVETGKRTMVLMAVSLALTAGGIIVAYLLVHAAPDPDNVKTMNAVLVERFAEGFTVAGLPLGHWFVLVTLLSEALLLFVAAQAGFTDGPRVMANMSTDSWLPHRFSQLSDRLTMQNGVLLMGTAAFLALWYSGGNVDLLVVMYSINVFLTFSLTEVAMCRFWFKDRKKHGHWKRHISVHVTGLILCVSILALIVYEKFTAGGWVTLVLTAALIALCYAIRRHYRFVGSQLRKLYATLEDLPQSHKGPVAALDTKAATAAVFVASYGGVGIHTVLNVFRAFPGQYKNVVFLSVGVVDSGAFKGEEELDALKKGTEATLEKYVHLANQMGFPATYRMAVGTDPVQECEDLGRDIANEFPRVTFFAGYILFQRERWYQRLLHNETAFAIQRRLQWAGMTMVILPARVN